MSKPEANLDIYVVPTVSLIHIVSFKYPQDPIFFFFNHSYPVIIVIVVVVVKI